MKKNKIFNLLKRPQNMFLSLGHRGLFNWMNDETYLKIAYWCKMGKKLELEHPVTFNEKLQWLKLNDRSCKHSFLADKYEVRNFVEKKIGKEYLNQLLGVWDNIDHINFDDLPNQFVLKCTHDSGGLVICKDKASLDIGKAKKKIKKSLKHNYYWGQREWVYKNIKPRIICEKYLSDEMGNPLKDYKFHCFNGKPKLIQVDFDRFENHKKNLYDLNWNHMEIEHNYPFDKNVIIEKPHKFQEMIKLSEILSEGFPYSRVDFYYINERIVFGEITFFPASGMGRFVPEEHDITMGNWLELPSVENYGIR